MNLTVKPRPIESKKQHQPGLALGTDDLPAGWRWVTLREIAQISGGLTKGQKRRANDVVCPVPYLRVANVQRGYLDLAEIKEIEATEQEVRALRLQPGDILFNEGGDRDKLGRGWVWHGELPECIHQNHVFRARLNDPNNEPKFISWYGNSAGQKYFYDHGKQTTNLASINMTKLGSLPIPLPPPDVQHQIVAELEKQFSRLDAGVAALERARANLKRYRASVLKAAVEGRLTADWRKAHPDVEPASELLKRILAERRQKWIGRGKYKEPNAPDTINLPLLPKNWAWVTAEQLTDTARPITYGVIKLGPPVEDGIPILRSSDVRHLQLDRQNVKRIAPKIANGYRRTFIQGHEILITVRGTLGGVTVVPDECKGFNISREVAMLALVESATEKSIAIFIASPQLQRWLMQRAKGIAYTGINIETLKQLPIPLPPLAEQDQIVQEVERLLSVADEQDALLTSNLLRGARLRQSFYEQAFSGKLL